MHREIDRQKKVVELMIRFYCKNKEGNDVLCPECRELLEYATKRLDKCRYGENKTSCRRCPTHCYKPQARERIKYVMRYSGPRMIFYAPWQTLKHWFGY